MKLHLDRYVVEEDGREIIPDKWWYTSFKAVSWSYKPKQDQRDDKSHRRKYQGSLFAGLAPRKASGSLLANPSPRASSKERRVSEEDNSLNLDLVGVKNAMEVVLAYEKDVGFYFTNFPDLELRINPEVDLSSVIDESALRGGKEKWNEFLEELMNGPAYENTMDSDESLASSFIGSISSHGDLHNSTPALSSIDLHRSEGSIDSIPMPSTPKPKLPFNEIKIKDASPTRSIDWNKIHSVHLSPSRSLNASASSFVPTFYSQLNEEPAHLPSLRDDSKSRSDVYSPPASFANFTFPTLNPTPPSVKVKKDEQGFFTEVQDENTPVGGSAANLLPPFLQEPSQRNRTRKSRTREIVDRIRSQVSPEESGASYHLHLNPISSKYASHSPSPIGDESMFVTPRLSVSEDGGDRFSRKSSPSCDDDDGWIDIAQPAVSASSPNQKSKRTRELFLALTRRRADSSSSGDLKETMASETSSGSSRSCNVSSSPSPSPSPHTPPLTSNDGWIESIPVSPPEPQKKPKASMAHGRKKSLNQQHHHSSSRTSISSSASSHLQQHPFSATSSSYPQLSPTTLSHQHHQHPQMVSPPAAFPYFFPAYPAVAMPSPYGAAFMQMPTYPMGMMHAVPAGSAVAGVPYVTPALMPVRSAATIKPSMTSTTPAYKANQPPLW